MIRTRFAPSPTGSLHIGNARIAVLNWLLARRDGGCFVLRIEDTDIDRNVAGAEAGIREDLLWLGLDWDEGPGRGPHGPYLQSERGATYERWAARLLDSGHAYACFCAADPGDDALERRERCPCATLSPADAAIRAALEPHTLRFRVPDGESITITDVVRGQVEFSSGEIADFVLLRSDGRPTYNFAVVIDDIEMRITHVIRGVGHLSNTPRQALLFDVLGVPRPVFAHVPMVLGPDRQKLSKRHGADGMAEYRDRGFHPDGMVNYLSLLSWSSPSGEDVRTRLQLIEEISLERIGAADAMFDAAKLSWLSARHIERMPLAALVRAVRPFLDHTRFDLDDSRLTAVVAATRTHYATFADVNEQLEAFFPATRVHADADTAATVAPDSVRDHVPDTVAGAGPDAGSEPLVNRAVLDAAATILTPLADWNEDALRTALQDIGSTARVKGRALYEPLRLALTGRAHGPPLAAILFVQGREPVITALNNARGARGLEAQ